MKFSSILLLFTFVVIYCVTTSVSLLTGLALQVNNGLEADKCTFDSECRIYCSTKNSSYTQFECISGACDCSV